MRRSPPIAAILLWLSLSLWMAACTAPLPPVPPPEPAPRAPQEGAPAPSGAPPAARPTPRPPASVPRTIAVWNLDALGDAGLPGVDLGELLADRVMTPFLDDTRWTVVEREQLLLALEELQIGSGEIAAEETRLRIGQIVGAHYMIFGNYLPFQHTMTLNLRLVAVETSRTIAAATRRTKENGIGAWLDLAESAGADLLKKAE